MTSDPTCETILIAAMAIADGEQPPIGAELVEAHLARCAACRADIESLDATAHLLDTCQRRRNSDDLWPALSRQMGVSPASSSERVPWAAFLALAFGLIGARVLLAASPDAAIAIKLFIVALCVATFALARENPFKIETELRLGQE